MRCFWCFSFEFTLCVFWIKLWRKMVIRVLVERFNYFLDESPVVKTLQFLLSWDFLLDTRLIWALKEAGGGGGREENESSQVILNRIRTTVCLLSLPVCVTETSLCFGSETCQFKLIFIISLGKLNIISDNVFNWNWFIPSQQSSCGSQSCTREWERWAQWNKE